LRRSILIAVLTALLVMALGVSSAFAGEVTGSGKNSDQNQGVSWCSFSGLNDDPEGLDPENGPPGKTQSYGQDVRLGLISPQEFNPGLACNPQKTFLPPNPNRTK
jgi:hypothetical protein